MGQIKMDCENIFNTKKRHTLYTISIHYLEFAIFSNLTFIFLYFYTCHFTVIVQSVEVEWVGFFEKLPRKRRRVP